MILSNQEDKKVYSDGEIVEQKMLEIAKQYPEDLSQNYIADRSEYTLNNTFSSVRQNILNWYSFKEDAEILEVGAGMGSLTGLLCDRAKHVTALEMSEARGKVIRARYPHRENLTILTENINTWKTSQTFDYIVIIGVLEYAGVFSDTQNPYEDFLESVAKLLKPDGKLLLAIENRFGLKYWSGASEDHLQKPFVGVAGYQDPKSPRTFSKNELEVMMEHVGLKYQRFYYVLPDYKFPEIICTDEFKPDYRNLKKISFTHAKDSQMLFDEKNVYKEIVNNGVLPFFANSYLIETSKSELEQKHVILISAKGEVKQQYRVNTLVFNDDEIQKKPMHELAKRHIEDIFQNTETLSERGVGILPISKKNGSLTCQRYKGISAQDYFTELLEKNDEENVKILINNLRDELIKSSDVESKNSVLDELGMEIPSERVGIILKNGYIDMTFYNAFIQDGKLLFYDQEWCFENIPLKFILYYALKTSYKRTECLTKITLDSIWLYLGIDKDLQRIFDKTEDYLWAKILYRQTDFYGGDGYCNGYNEEDTLKKFIENTMQKSMDDVRKAEEKLTDTENKLADTENKLTDTENKLTEVQEQVKCLVIDKQELESIKASKMFKISRFICNIIDFFLKMGRYFISFFIMIGHVSPKKLGVAWNYMLNEGVTEAYHHMMRDYYKGQQKIDVKVDKEIYQEIKDITKCTILNFNKYEKPQVSIVIPVYNQFTYTYYCLKSILEQTVDVTYEVIIADDCSNDLTKELSKIVTNVKIIRNETNLLFLRNCNNAAKCACGEFILFLNNDTQVQKNWLSPLVNLLDTDKTIGMAGSKLIYADGTLQEAGGIIWQDGSGWNYGRNQDATLPEYNYIKNVDYISGASIIIRHALWKEIGGFDEYFAPAYCEDSDLAFQVREKGFRVVYQPKSVVVHFEGKSNGIDVHSGIKQYQLENAKKFKEKWKAQLENQEVVGVNVFRARERSEDKKVLLMVDHYVPQYDKDAGSKTVFQYLDMFVRKGYIVKFIGDNFYKHEPYTSQLQQMGIEVLYGTYYAENWQKWIEENGKQIDYIWLNRPHISVKYIDVFRKNSNAKIVYYGHDLHFLRLQREYELTHKEDYKQDSEEWKRKELLLMNKADISYYPSNVEVQAIHDIDLEIPVQAITAYAYNQFRHDISIDFDKREGLLFVGGFGHPPNEDAVLWFAQEILPMIERKDNYPVYIVGSNPTDEIIKLKKIDGLVIKGFVSDEELKVLYDTCRMVIAPLRYGAGVKGKIVEAIYNGIPVVTTSVGAEGIEKADELFILADTSADFATRINNLYDDTNRLQKLSMDYQEYIQENFSIDAVWNKIEEDFR